MPKTKRKAPANNSTERCPDRLESLAAIHTNTRKLLQVLSELGGLFAHDTPADWGKVQEAFTVLAAARVAIEKHIDALPLFHAHCPPAVEFGGIVFSSWHAAIVQSFVWNGHHSPLMVWVGSMPGTEETHVCHPDDLNWDRPDLGIRPEVEKSNVCRDRNTIWQRLRLRTDPGCSREVDSEAILSLLRTPSMGGWGYLKCIDPWKLLVPGLFVPGGHLIAEYGAAERELGKRRDVGYSCATALAAELGLSEGKVKTFLTRYADKNPDCRNAAEVRGRREPQYVYSRAVILPALRAYFHLL